MENESQEPNIMRSIGVNEVIGKIIHGDRVEYGQAIIKGEPKYYYQIRSKRVQTESPSIRRDAKSQHCEDARGIREDA
jgi:hypothetical protein